MTTLATLRTSLRSDLHDTVSASYRWTDAALDRHILHAVERYQDAWPQDVEAAIATTAGTIRYSLGALTGLIWVERVWYPYDAALEPVWISFRVDGGELELLDVAAPSGAETIRVFYAKLHQVDASGSTIPREHEYVVLTGAAGYALAEHASYAPATVNPSAASGQAYFALSRDRLAEFERQLAGLRVLRAARGDSRLALRYHDSAGNPL